MKLLALKSKEAVGGASESTMTKLIGPERAKEAVEILRPIFEKEMLNGLIALPGANEILKLLMIKVSKLQYSLINLALMLEVCEHLGLEKHLEFIIGDTDTIWRKPDFNLTRFALEKLKASNEETIYVGDSPYDFQTARNANMHCI